MGEAWICRILSKNSPREVEDMGSSPCPSGCLIGDSLIVLEPLAENRSSPPPKVCPNDRTVLFSSLKIFNYSI